MASEKKVFAPGPRTIAAVAKLATLISHLTVKAEKIGQRIYATRVRAIYTALIGSDFATQGEAGYKVARGWVMAFFTWVKNPAAALPDNATKEQIAAAAALAETFAPLIAGLTDRSLRDYAKFAQRLAETSGDAHKTGMGILERADAGDVPNVREALTAWYAATGGAGKFSEHKVDDDALEACNPATGDADDTPPPPVDKIGKAIGRIAGGLADLNKACGVDAPGDAGDILAGLGSDLTKGQVKALRNSLAGLLGEIVDMGARSKRIAAQPVAER